MASLQPPSDLSRREKKAFREVAQSLVAQGIEPSTRVMLIEELVRLESRLDALRAAEKDVGNTSNLAATRALNVATAERRRLHDAVFKGARQPAAVPPSMEERAAATVNEADEAWRAHFRNGKGLICNTNDPAMERRIKRWRREDEELADRYGEPSWAALLHETLEEQLEADRRMEALWRAQPSAKRRLDAQATIRGED